MAKNLVSVQHTPPTKCTSGQGGGGGGGGGVSPSSNVRGEAF